MVDYSKHGGYVDIVDSDNNPTGEVLPLKIANKRKLFHRGANVVLLTPDNHIYAQKRSKKQFFMPSYIDVTLGGSCDPGETPEQAAVREMFEETGIRVAQKDLQFIDCHREFVWRPSRRTHSCVFSYTYAVRLTEDYPDFVIQKEEADSMRRITLPQFKRLVKRGYLPGLGRLVTTRARYQKVYDYLAKNML